MKQEVEARKKVGERGMKSRDREQGRQSTSSDGDLRLGGARLVL